MFLDWQFPAAVRIVVRLFLTRNLVDSLFDMSLQHLQLGLRHLVDGPYLAPKDGCFVRHSILSNDGAALFMCLKLNMFLFGIVLIILVIVLSLPCVVVMLMLILSLFVFALLLLSLLSSLLS